MHETLEDFRARFRTRFVVHDGWVWECAELAGPGEPVVFLAGAQGTNEMFFKPLLRLAGKRHLLAVHYSANWDACAIAEDLFSVLNRLGHQTVSIVGSSFGSYVGQFAGALFPERINRLILGNLFVDASDVKSLPFFDERELMTTDPVTFKAERMAQFKTMEPGAFRDIMLDQVGARQSAEHLYSRFLGVAKSVPAPKITVPKNRVTIIDCEDDNVITPAMKAIVRDRFEGFDIRILPTGGHFPNILNPDGYTDLLREVLLTPGHA